MKYYSIELKLWDENLKYKTNAWKYEILDHTRKKREKYLVISLQLKSQDDLLLSASQNW